MNIVVKQKTEHPDHKLPLDEDIRLTEMSWPVQRIGWALLLLFMLAAVAGLFGNGIFSEVKQHSGEYQIEYERFGRYEMPQQVTIRAKAVDGRVRLVVKQKFTEDYDIDLITPLPKTEHFEDDTIVLEFEANSMVTLVFMLEAQRPGTIKAPITVNGHPFTINQFVYP